LDFVNNLSTEESEQSRDETYGGGLGETEENVMNARSVPRDWTTQRRLLELEATRQPERPKQLVAAMLGAPNSGKSTLANSLVGRKICSVSKRVDTTLHKTLAISTEGDTQLIFFDTPGIVDPFKKKHYADSLLRDPHSVLAKADVIIVVVDISQSLFRSALHPEIIKVLLMRQDKETILVLNKVDVIRQKGQLFGFVRALTGGVVGEQKSHQTFMETEKEKKDKYRERHIDPKELARRLIAENEATVGEDGQLVASVSSSLDPSLSATSSPDVSASTVPLASKDIKITRSPEGLQDYMRQQTIPCPEKDWEEYRKYLRWLHPRVATLTKWSQFSKVFLVSALEADGTDDIKEHLKEIALPGPWSFDDQVLTDQNPKEIVLMTVREKLLDYVAEDVPYTLKLRITEWKQHNLYLEIHVSIGFTAKGKAKMKRDAMFLLGKKGEAIKRVGADARKALMDTFLCDISLKLHVKAPPLAKSDTNKTNTNKI